MKEQLKAIDALLDIGVSIPLRPLKFHRWKIIPRIVIRRPPLGGLLRITKIWLSIGISASELEKMNETQRFEFMQKHGKEVIKMVSLMVHSGRIKGVILAPILAFILKWRCHPDTLIQTASVFFEAIDSKSFTTITRSVGALNLAAPRLGQRKKGS